MGSIQVSVHTFRCEPPHPVSGLRTLVRSGPVCLGDSQRTTRATLADAPRYESRCRVNYGVGRAPLRPECYSQVTCDSTSTFLLVRTERVGSPVTRLLSLSVHFRSSSVVMLYSLENSTVLQTTLKKPSRNKRHAIKNGW